MLFNTDHVKQVIKVCFSYKPVKVAYPPLQFNNNNVRSTNSQKHLGLVLDSKLKAFRVSFRLQTPNMNM